MIIESFFLFLLCRTREEVLSIDIAKYHCNRPEIAISFPNEEKTTVIGLNTFLPFSVIRLTPSLLIADRIKQKETLELDDTYKSVLYQTDFLFNSQTRAHNVLAYNAESSTMYYKDHGLGLGLRFSDESFSVVHRLYRENAIQRLQFGFHNMNESLGGSFFIGGVPNDGHLQMKFKGVIKVNETLPTWGFSIDEIVIKKRKIDVKIPAIISTRADNFLSSDDLYEMFEKEVFREDIERNICKKRKSGDYLYIECPDEFYKNLTFEMVIDNNKIEISPSLFIESFYGLVTSNYRNNNGRKEHNFTGVIIGPHLLAQYNYSIFDYDKKQIELYSDTFMITSLTEHRKIIFTAESILLLFNCIILVYLHYK